MESIPFSELSSALSAYGLPVRETYTARDITRALRCHPYEFNGLLRFGFVIPDATPLHARRRYFTPQTVLDLVRRFHSNTQPASPEVTA